MTDEQTKSFIDAYRDHMGQYSDYLSRQYATNLQALDNNRRNQFQNIMGTANTAGMMYSNFPKRSKIQYDASVYEPAKDQMFSTYQTGLDKLRSNTVNMLNTLADYKDEIASLNKQYQNSNMPAGSIKLNSSGDYVYNSLIDGSQFRNTKGDKIKMGTALKRAGVTGNQDILRAAEKVLQPEEFQRLKTIVDAQQSTKHPNLIYNVGDSYYEPDLSYLSDPDQALMKALGFDFGQ